MDMRLLEEAARVQQDLRLLKMTVESLEARVDEIVARLQEQATSTPMRLVDLEGIWEGADFSLEDIKASEYHLPDDI